MPKSFDYRVEKRIVLHAFRAGALLFSLAALASPAKADDGTDPFAFDASHWISFDHYKEKTRHGQSYVDDAPVATPAPDAQAARTPELAPPQRPLNPPLMPGVNRDFDIRVNSTADDVGPMAEIANLESQPTMEVPAFSWQKASNAAQSYAKNNGELQPLDIRMSYLPKISQPPKIKPNPSMLKARVDAALAQHKEPKKQAEDDARDLAALDAYKKEQLDAIQSDRKTLEALQAAIKDLGLQKQLNFIAGAQGSVVNSDNTGGEAAAAPSDIAAPQIK